MTSQDQFLYFRGLNPEEVNITPIGTYCAQSISSDAILYLSQNTHTEPQKGEEKYFRQTDVKTSCNILCLGSVRKPRIE